MTTRLWAGPLAGMTLEVAVAWGADLTDTTGAGWTWTDITADVRQDPGIQTKLGRNDESAKSNPATMTLTLDNPVAAYSLGGHSPNYPYVRRGTPVRVRVDPADGLGFRVLFLGNADGWSPAWDDGPRGRRPVVELEASGTLRRLIQGDAPLASAYRRTMEATPAVSSYWPMEENRGALTSPALRGGPDLVFDNPTDIDWSADDSFESSDALPQLNTCRAEAIVNAYTNTGNNQVRFFLKVPQAGLADGTVLAYIYTSGSLARWDLVYASSGTGNLGLYRYNSDGTLNSSVAAVTFDMNGNRRRFALRMVQNGADIDWRFEVLDANPGDPGGGFTGTILGRTVGIVTRVILNPLGQTGDTAFGHLTVQNTIGSAHEAASAFWAWQRALGSLTFPEFAYASPAATFSRLYRLMTENGVALTVYSSGSAATDTITFREGMGPQLLLGLVPLLQECEQDDRGQLWDGRSAGLAYTTRRHRENEANRRLTLDASAGQLGVPFSPVDDDQRTRNRVEATRTAGATAVYEDITGPMGTATIGTYDTSVKINGADDTMMIQQAAFTVALGTIYGYRYPSVTLDLRKNPDLAAGLLDMVPGERIKITNISTVLAGFPNGDVELIVEGIAHELSDSGWSAVLRCSPGSPWLTAHAADSPTSTDPLDLRADTDGATVAVTTPRNSTTLPVASAGTIWTVDPNDYPLTLDVGGVPVVASACSGAASPQTFTVAPLVYDRTAGSVVKLWDARPLGL